jgi:hypothetical protein
MSLSISPSTTRTGSIQEGVAPYVPGTGQDSPSMYGQLDGNLIAAAGFAVVDNVVNGLSVPNTDGQKARMDLGITEIRTTLGQAKDAVALLTKGAETASDMFLGRNAGFAADHAAEGVEHLTWLEDVIGNFKEPNPSMIDMHFEKAHKSFLSAQFAYGLE